jgi:hypothetical protein
VSAPERAHRGLRPGLGQRARRPLYPLASGPAPRLTPPPLGPPPLGPAPLGPAPLGLGQRAAAPLTPSAPAHPRRRPGSPRPPLHPSHPRRARARLRAVAPAPIPHSNPSNPLRRNASQGHPPRRAAPGLGEKGLNDCAGRSSGGHLFTLMGRTTNGSLLRWWRNLGVGGLLAGYGVGQ